MPPSLRTWMMKSIPDKNFDGNIPWTPMQKPVKDTSFALMTSAGISLKTDPVFDMEREKREPTWGDPSFRKIPKTATEADIDVNHLHINTDYIKQDKTNWHPPVISPIVKLYLDEIKQAGAEIRK